MLDPDEGLAAGATLKDKYRIEERLGAGGMAFVYRARNLAVDRTVAIKVLNPRLTQHKEAVQRFKQEAKAANVARHPNIVDVLDVDQDGGILFIVQEYLRGEDLAARLRRDKQLIVDDVLAILEPVVQALAAAHAKGLVHRDLKPENVFLAQVDGRMVPKILDFGISKVPFADFRISGLGSAPLPIKGGRITVAGVAMGTPYYMSPEQIRDPSSVDARSDIWSLGVIMYEALSGSMPFDAENMTELFAQIHTHEPRPLNRIAPHVPAGLARVVHKCLRVAREERYADAVALTRALERAKSPLGDEPSHDASDDSRSSGERVRSGKEGSREMAFAVTELGVRPSVKPPESAFSLELDLPVSTSRAPPSTSGAPSAPASDPAERVTKRPAPAAPLEASAPPVSNPGYDLSGLGFDDDDDDDEGGPLQLAVDVPSSKDSAPRAPRPIVAATAERASDRGTDRPVDSQRRIHIRQHVDAPLSAAYVRFMLVAILVLGLAVGSAYVAPAGVDACQALFGSRAAWPFAGTAVVILFALIWTATHGLRMVSFSLFLASAGLAVSATGSAFAALSMAGPGLVPSTVITVGLLAAPWAAVAAIAGFALFGLVHGRALRKSDQGEKLLGNLLIMAGLLGLGAGAWAARQRHPSLDEVKNMRPAIALPAREQFRRVAIDVQAARPTLVSSTTLPLRTPSRGGAALKRVPPRPPEPKKQ